VSVSLVTLGSPSSSQLAHTINASLPFAKNIVSQWIFVLYSSDEVHSFEAYLSNSQLSLCDIEYVITWSCSGIAASINEGIRLATCTYTLIVHMGDSLLSLPESQFNYIKHALSSSEFMPAIHVFGTVYECHNGLLTRTNHMSYRSRFRKLFPWVPHESTFVPTVFYSSRNYSTRFRSALDYDFFLYHLLHDTTFFLHPLYITKFALGGTSSNILESSLELRHSLALNNFAGHKYLSFVLSYLLFLFFFSFKILFLLKTTIQPYIRFHFFTYP